MHNLSDEVDATAPPSALKSSEAGVCDQSTDEPAAQRRVHGRRLARSGRHSDHRSDAPKVVEIASTRS